MGGAGGGGRGGEGEGDGGGWVLEKALWLAGWLAGWLAVAGWLAGCQKAKKALFGLQNLFLAPKLIVAPKVHFGAKKPKMGSRNAKN